MGWGVPKHTQAQSNLLRARDGRGLCCPRSRCPCYRTAAACSRLFRCIPAAPAFGAGERECPTAWRKAATNLPPLPRPYPPCPLLLACHLQFRCPSAAACTYMWCQRTLRSSPNTLCTAVSLPPSRIPFFPFLCYVAKHSVVLNHRFKTSPLIHMHPSPLLTLWH
jgi:hypothetical protein